MPSARVTPRRSPYGFVARTLLAAALCAAVSVGWSAAGEAPASGSKAVAAASAGDSASPAPADTVRSSRGAVPESTGEARPASVAGYVAQIRADYTPRARDYWTLQTALAFISPVYDIAVALILLFTGLSARMRDLAYARAKRLYGRVLIYLVLFSAAAFVLSFPLIWFRGFALEHRFGLSNQSFAAWLGDAGKDVLVDIVVLGATGLLSLVYLAIRRSPRRWWLWVGLGVLPVSVAVTLIEPVAIDPLYNKFTPLQNQRLEEKILALAAKAEIPARHVYQVDRSKQTKKYNAYVNGFGASQRIVLWDTTLEGMKEDEILFVMGHEMGHYRLGHIWQGIALYWLLGFALLAFCWALMNGAIRRFGGRWRFHELHDVASLPLLVATLTLAGMIASPIIDGYSRRVERQADVFGLEVTHLNDAAARAFIKLGSQNLANPEPPRLVALLLYTHPPLIERVRFALSYRPWAEGRPNRRFKPSRPDRGAS